MRHVRHIKILRAGLPHGAAQTHRVFAATNADLVRQCAALLRETARRLGVSTLALEWEIV